MPSHNPNADAGDNANDGSDTSQTVTQEQLNQTVNAAVSSHMKRLESRLSQTIGAVIADQLKDKIPTPTDDDDPSPGDPDPSPGEGKSDPAMTALKRQISTLTNKLQKAEDARAAEADQRRKDALKSAVLKHLGEAGLAGQHLRGAQAVLYQDGRVHVDADGNHLFRDAEGVDLPLAEGLTDWVKSEDAKLFLPPKDVRGSGDQGSDKSKLPKMKTDELSQAYSDAVEGVSKFLLNE